MSGLLDSQRGRLLLTGGVLALALVARLVTVARLPVVFDEVCVMAYGLTRALEGPPRVFLFEVPVAVSNGVTPVWFWLQAAPAAALGAASKSGLRLLPVLLGLASVWLTHRLASRLHGPRAGLVAGLLAAVFSPYLFASARGEYTESLLVPLLLLLYRDLRAAEGGAPRRTAPLWVALALLTHLGKGLVVWAAFALALAFGEVLTRAAARRSGASRPAGAALSSSARRLAILVLAPLLPTAAWLALAQRSLFGSGRTLLTALGPVADVWTNVRRLTLGYGHEAQPSMVAGWREALYVYTDFAAWPTLALVAVPALAGGLALMRDLRRALRAGDVVGTAGPAHGLVLVIVPLGVLLAKGALDVRFHLLYLPIALLHAAGAIDRWLRGGEAGRLISFSLWGLAGWAFVAWTQFQADPAALAAHRSWLLLGGLALLATLARRPASGLLAAGLVLFTVASGLGLGPPNWGHRWAWEPSPIASDVPREVRSFGSVDLQLARCCLARGEAERARPYLRRAVAGASEDRDTLLDAASLLLDAGPTEREIVLRGLAGHRRRHPDDAEAARLLDRALALPPAE